MTNILYLGHYGSAINQRLCSPAAITMMQYVAGAIQHSGYPVTILSPAQCAEKCKATNENQNGVKISYLSSHGTANGIFNKAIHRLQRQAELYETLEKNISNDTVLLVYHSLAYMEVLKKLRQRKKCKLVLQVNEIYSDVSGNQQERAREIEWINAADGYIFSTELLTQQIDCKNKRYAICLGTYQEEEVFTTKNQKKEGIHVIYAGTFANSKGGGDSYWRGKISSVPISLTCLRLWKRAGS